jgi:surfeit locus 1 family protein
MMTRRAAPADVMVVPRLPRFGAFTRSLIVLIASVLGVAVTARMGLWQIDRAAQKTALQSAIDERARLPELPASALARSDESALAQHHRAVRVQGQWLNDRTVFLDNRQMDGRPGFIVVTPLRLAGESDAVLVQRGWAPRDARDRSALPKVAAPVSGEALGRVAPPPARLYEFAADEAGPIRQNLDLDRFSREIGVPLRPLSLLQQEDATVADDGLLRHWPRPAVDVHKHQGYAFQWFALCALIAGLYVWFQLLHPRLGRYAR